MKPVVIYHFPPNTDPDSRLKTILHTHHLTSRLAPDILSLTSSTTIGIDATRQIKHFLLTTPQQSPHKYVLIPNGESLTHPAQNSLLKILEEPPSFAQIIIATANPLALLPTILSRCHTDTSFLTSPHIPTPLDALVTPLSQLPLHQRLSQTDQLLSTKSNLPQLLLDTIIYYRHQLRHQPNSTTLYNLTLCLYTHQLLHHNTNPKLALDYLLLHLKP